MSVKQKILDGLGCALDHISEERLIDILLDAYKAKQRHIEQLEGENAHEREMLHAEHESLRREQEKMRRDPLYCAHGRYFFAVNGRRFIVDVQGGQIDMCEREKRIDVRAQRLSAEEFGG